MSLEALKKAANSSKVLLFLIFAVACTVALKIGMVESAWYQDTMANAFYLLMGGYSVVEAARAIWSSKSIDINQKMGAGFDPDDVAKLVAEALKDKTDGAEKPEPEVEPVVSASEPPKKSTR